MASRSSFKVPVTRVVMCMTWREFLDQQVIMDFHGTEFRHLAHIVPGQIHQHIVFRQFLGIRLQVFFQGPVFLFRAPSPAGAQMMGMDVISRSWTLIRVSGLDPAISRSSFFSSTMYWEGLVVRRIWYILNRSWS